MADPSTWPSAGKHRQGVSPMWGRAPSGAFRLPQAPHLERFALIQRGALQQAIKRSRERTSRHDAGVGSAPPFGLNRQYRSILEARMKWWAQAGTALAGTYARSTERAAEAHVEPNWGQIQRDLQGLMGALGASLYAAFDDNMGAQALAALAAWPDDTGLSRALLHAEIGPGAGGHGELMRGSLVAGAGYSGYIKASGFRVVRQQYITKKGEAKTRTKHVYGEGRMPAWKARYLVKQADGRWRFDADAFEKAQAAGGAEARADYKPAKGKPYHDLIARPARATVAAIGRQAVEGAVKGAN